MASEWSGADYQRAMFRRTDLFRMVQRWFETADLSRDADAVAHRAADRTGSVRADPHRLHRGGRAAAQLVPLHHAVQHHRPPALTCAAATMAKACRSACNSSAASATRPRCCARRRFTRRARPGWRDGPTFDPSSGPRASRSLRRKSGPEARGPEDSKAAPASYARGDPGPRAPSRRVDPGDRQAGRPCRPRRPEQGAEPRGMLRRPALWPAGGRRHWRIASTPTRRACWYWAAIPRRWLSSGACSPGATPKRPIGPWSRVRRPPTKACSISRCSSSTQGAAGRSGFRQGPALAHPLQGDGSRARYDVARAEARDRPHSPDPRALHPRRLP